MRLVAYVRVSTDRQAEEGLGIPIQEQAVTEWAKRNGHRLDGPLRAHDHPPCPARRAALGIDRGQPRGGLRSAPPRTP